MSHPIYLFYVLCGKRIELQIVPCYLISPVDAILADTGPGMAWNTLPL